MNALDMLIKNIVSNSYEALPVEVVEATKKQVLDTLGTAIAGSRTGKMDELVALLKDWGGKEESTIIGYGGKKVPAPNAALVNGTLSCLLDYDDTHDIDQIHASRSIVTSCFAITERKGAVNGRNLVAAIALGFDLAARLSRAIVLHIELGWDPAAPNFFGSAATVGKILNLDEEKLTHALGIAYQQLSGADVGILEGPSIKGMSGGLAAKAGIIAALMAERGYTSGPDCLEGKKGFYNTFCRGIYIPGLLTLDLGKDFRSTTNSQKEYPCCHLIQTPIEATLAIVHEHNIKPTDIAEVIAHVGQQALPVCEPLEMKYSPQNAVQGQFSLPWAVASAIIHRQVGLENFTEESIRDTKVLEMARKVVYKLHTELTAARVGGPTIIEIKTKGGDIYSKRVDFPFGSPENPMSLDDVARKFRDCCAYSGKTLPQENVDKVIHLVERLEDVDDINKIVRLLA